MPAIEVPVRLLLPIAGNAALTLRRDVVMPGVPRVGDEVLVDADEQEPVTVARVSWQLDDPAAPGAWLLLDEFDLDVVAESLNAAVAALAEQGWVQHPDG